VDHGNEATEATASQSAVSRHRWRSSSGCARDFTADVIADTAAARIRRAHRKTTDRTKAD
jgi:hypothetical protein